MAIFGGLALLASAIEAAERLPVALGRKLSSIDAGLQERVCPGYSRDLFPLPLVSPSTFTLPVHSFEAAETTLLKLINASTVGLNHLRGDGDSATVNATPNSAQRAALGSIGHRWWQLGTLLSESLNGVRYDPLAFDGLVSRKLGSVSSDLCASRVDVLDKCAQVDAKSFLPSEIRAVAESPDRLFDVTADNFTHSVTYSGGSRAEYTRLLRRQCRAGKITFSAKCAHSAQVFSLVKKYTGTLREVWNGSSLCINGSSSNSAVVGVPHEFGHA